MKITDQEANFNTDGALHECISSPEEMLLFDIETTGLKKEYCRVYLTGCAYLSSGRWRIKQWLSQNASDEKAVLEAFASFACAFRTLVTFNGERFDIPFLEYRNKQYGVNLNFADFRSLDIYKEIKPAKKLLGASSLRQKAVEELIGIKRDDKMDGGALIPYYYEYEQTLDEKNEKLLLLHNFDDVEGMGRILPALSYPDILKGRFEYNGYEIIGDSLEAAFTLERPVPAPFKNGAAAADGNLLTVSFDIKNGKVCLPVRDYRNYYYLPLEDKVIHKDLAAFVGRKYKRKAVKSDCFLKVETAQIEKLEGREFKEYALNVLRAY